MGTRAALAATGRMTLEETPFTRSSGAVYGYVGERHLSVTMVETKGGRERGHESMR